jgi:hypothetical protein
MNPRVAYYTNTLDYYTLTSTLKCNAIAFAELALCTWLEK